MSDSRVATVVVENAHVVYEVYEDRSAGLKHLFAAGRVRRRARRIHAVRGVSFEVYEGETLGIVGSNGSGKSSLLAAMTGLLPMESGEIWVKSRPALLGVSAALRPSLSGRRNILIGCLALGLAPKEIEQRTDEIIDFAGLREFIDLPMRTYSSGMRARLNFAIATAATPTILLIDEALAVGDDDFQRRSQRRINEIRGSAGSVVLVSHNLSEIERSCDRVIWLEKGELLAEGSPDHVIATYLSTQSVDAVRPATMVLDALPEDQTESGDSPLPQPVEGRRALLHIGVATAADDTLQQDLYERRGELIDAGFLYPAFLGTTDHRRFAAYGSAEIAEIAGFCTPSEWEAWCDEFRLWFLRASATGGDLLVTSLWLSELDEVGIRRVTDLLAEGGFETIEAVVFVRRQDEMAALTHVRRVLRGGPEPFDIDEVLGRNGRYDFERAIARWESVPAVDAVHVRLHRDRAELPSAEIVFAELAGFTPPPLADFEAEVPLQPATLAMVRRINAETTELPQSWLLTRDAEPRMASLGEDDARRLLDAHRESNARVLARVPAEHRVDDYFAAPRRTGDPEAPFDDDDLISYASKLSDQVALLSRQVRRLRSET